MNSGRILILTYYWPPSGGGGVQRWMYFAKYLKLAGYNPLVITVNPEKASYPLIDETQMDMVNAIDTLYTDTLEPFKWYSFLKSGTVKKQIPYGDLGNNTGGWFGKIMAFVRANFFIPDARKGWNPYLKKAAVEALNEEKFTWIISTGPPHSTHLAALYLSKKFGVKWMADFRDPWSEIYFLQNVYRFNWAKKRDKALELKVLNSADLVLTVGPSMAELLKSKMGMDKSPQVIYNGYDQALFDGIKTPTEKNKFVITHLGLLGPSQKFDVFMHALKQSGIDLSKVELRLTGSVYGGHLELLKGSLPELNLIQQKFLPRREAVESMVSSSLLLLCPPMEGETRLIVSTKTMEYLASGTPILGIGDPLSDAAALVSQQNISGFFAVEDLKGIAQFLGLSFQNWQQNIPAKSTFDVSAFSRKAAAEKLIKLLDWHA